MRSEAGAVARLGPWFHNLHLPGGMQTAPVHPFGDFPRVKWRQIEPFVPRDLGGCRALDIGCNAGFYSFELARRGAQVTAIDVDAHYLRQARWAARRYGLSHRIDFCRASVYALARSREQFDFVWFLGVLYHLRHPLLALDILRDVTRGQMVLQTMTSPDKSVIVAPESIGLDERRRLNRRGWPRMAFIERALEDDPTNWWTPNHACVEAMLRAAGFEVIAHPGHEIYLCRPNRDETRFGADSRRRELNALFGERAKPLERKPHNETSSHSHRSPEGAARSAARRTRRSEHHADRRRPRRAQGHRAADRLADTDGHDPPRQTHRAAFTAYSRLRVARRAR